MNDVSTTPAETTRDGAGDQPVPGPETLTTQDAGATDVLQLLGLIAFTELATFTRLAAVAAGAPTPTQHLHLVRLAGAALDRQERILRRITELGGDADAEMLQFTGTFDDYDSRTEPQTWWEGVLKGYVGNGVADDFCRIAVDGLDEQTRAVVVEVLDDNRSAELSVAVLGEASGADTVLASRLALWGRRLVGEALGLVQHLLGSHPALGRLVVEGARRRQDAAEADQAWVFSQLTAEHTRRMGRLGLAA
ncbi:ferritin-like fold-containing protein [Sanguibacter sp. 25GB23B1]|uniref:ferritin-like fold-containing protein n=1 Tax=unclassified Sanguibacter TaxID=2645534 RepID=UPI0032AF3AFC